MKYHQLLIFIFLFSCSVLAQEETVKKIRQDYLEYNKKLQDSETEDGYFGSVPFKFETIQMRPALGPVNISLSYYYDEETKDSENDDTNNRNSIGTLRKIIYQESMPSYTEYREFFFDYKGALQFYYSKLTGYSCGEKRFYFDKVKLIKVKFNPLEGENCIEAVGEDKFPDFTRYPGKFTKDDLDWEKWILNHIAYHKKAFQNLFESLQ